MENKLNSARFWIPLICLLCAALFAIRITGPTDLEGYAQMLNVGYVMDMMWQGHWLVQHNIENGIMSKPPLHTWLIAPFAAVLGINHLSLSLPSLLSVLGLGLLIFHVGRQRFGIVAGGFAALAMVLASPMMDKQITLVRTDPLFALTVAAAAFAAFNAWENDKGGGKGWTLFWLAGALATLTKGPLGLLLAAGGLLCYFWEKRTDPDTQAPRGSQLAGIAIFLLAVLGWFLLAYQQAGSELTNKQFGEELIGQAVGAHKPAYSLRNALTPTGFLLMRFLPFSLFLFYALWRVFRHPAENPGERRFERFLTCWLLLGLFIFSVIKHQRPDHLLPLWPAAALLIGRELARLGCRFGLSAHRLMQITAGTCIVLLSLTFLRSHQYIATEGKTTRYSVEVEKAAAALAKTDINPAHLVHFDTPVTLQMYLKTFRPWKTAAELDQLVANAGGPVEIALGPSKIEALGFVQHYPNTVRIFRWPANESKEAVIQVYRVTP